MHPDEGLALYGPRTVISPVHGEDVTVGDWTIPTDGLPLCMNSAAHPGMSGRIELLKFEDGTAVGRSDGDT